MANLCTYSTFVCMRGCEQEKHYGACDRILLYIYMCYCHVICTDFVLLQLQELREREEKVKVFKKFYIENPLLLSLCGTLFPDNQRSVWSGPHSLVQHQDSGHTSSIHAAIETFMK
jgi:hypothetical protein